MAHFLLDVRPAHFCSMKITQDVRDFAAAQGLDEGRALERAWKPRPSNSSRPAPKSLPSDLSERPQAAKIIRVAFFVHSCEFSAPHHAEDAKPHGMRGNSGWTIKTMVRAELPRSGTCN